VEKIQSKKVKIKLPKIKFLEKVEFMSGSELLKNTLFTIILWTAVASLIYGLDNIIQLILTEAN
jgi:preprotein translocase subunit SecE